MIFLLLALCLYVFVFFKLLPIWISYPFLSNFHDITTSESRTPFSILVLIQQCNSLNNNWFIRMKISMRLVFRNLEYKVNTINLFWNDLPKCRIRLEVLLPTTEFIYRTFDLKNLFVSELVVHDVHIVSGSTGVPGQAWLFVSIE